MKVWLIAAILAVAPPALAQELQWMGSGDATGAVLKLGYPNSDYIPLAFWCVPHVDTVYVAYEFIPANPSEGMEIDFTMTSGDTVIEVGAIGREILIDDSFVLEGQILFGEQFVDLITSGGVITMTSGGIAKEFSLAGAREASTPLLDMCKGSGTEP